MNLTWSIFPKFFQHFSAPQLAELIQESGLDTTNLVIRDGYWVTRGKLAAELPMFLQTMSAAGLDVRFATAGYSVDELVQDSSPLHILAQNGIREFRMGYFGNSPEPRKALAAARAKMEQLVPLCEKAGIRAVYQVHHNTLIAGASAAYALVQGLPSQYIGIELDPGNQVHEGLENWTRSAQLLDEYLVAWGIKDVAYIHDAARADEPSKGWFRKWVPLDEGVINWHDVSAAMKAVDFSGTLVFMPFYDDQEPAVQAQKLKREVAYLRAIIG